MTVAVRTWETFFSHPSLDLTMTWYRAVADLAVRHSLQENPDFVSDQDKDLPDQLKTGELPEWWPAALPRIEIRIEFRPDDDSPETREPSPIQPTGKDLGLRHFEAVLLATAKAYGHTFSGSLDVSLFRINTRNWIGGFRIADLHVGSGQVRGKAGERHPDDMVNWYAQQYKEMAGNQQEMFRNSASVINASAALVNASRGHNPAPPWADGEKSGGTGWMDLLMQALSIGMESDKEGSRQRGDYHHNDIPQYRAPQIPDRPQALIEGPVGADPSGGWTHEEDFGEPVRDDDDEEESGSQEQEETGWEQPARLPPPATMRSQPAPVPWAQEEEDEPRPSTTSRKTALDDLDDDAFAAAVAERAARMDKKKVISMGRQIMGRIGLRGR